MTALWYRSGSAFLLHRGTGRMLAGDNVGQPADGSEDATDFSMVLRGAPRDGHTPKPVEKALAGSREHVALLLDVQVTVQVHVGALGFGQRRLLVRCDIGAAGLRKDVHISSQSCKSRFVN